MQCLISFVCTWTDVDLRKTSNCQSGLWQKCQMTYQSFLLSPHMQMQYLINAICIIEWENASLLLSYVYEVGSCLSFVDCSWIISWLDWVRIIQLKQKRKLFARFENHLLVLWDPASNHWSTKLEMFTNSAFPQSETPRGCSSIGIGQWDACFSWVPSFHFCAGLVRRGFVWVGKTYKH